MKVFNAPEDYTAVNLASGQGYSIKHILQTLIELDGYKDAPVHFIKDKPRTIPARFVDTTLAEKKYGFKPAHSLKEGLAKTLSWYRRNKLPVPSA